MTFKLLRQFISASSRFARANAGNVAPIFAFTALPLLAATGAAVDYSRAVNARSAMQAAVDSTALMLAQDAATLSSTDLTNKAKAYFNALYTNSEVAGITITAAFTPNTGNGATVVLTGQGTMNTDFMKMAGYPTMSLNVTSTSTWGNNKLRVAMALDVTGSMNDDLKLPTMIAAAQNLIDTLRSSSKATGDVYVSVIPFNVMVNVGSANKTSSWVDWDTDYGSCSNNNYSRKSTCTAAGKTWTASGVNNWVGCVEDRDQSYDQTKDAPTTSNNGTLYIAQSYSGCRTSSALLPQTSIYSVADALTVKTMIGGLTAGGNTNQAIGLQLAWMTLQQTAPFNAPAKDSNVAYTDAIILLSDGMNTQNRWSTNQTTIDNRQKTLCDNIKNTSVNGKTVIYTIQVNTGGDPESAVLKYCGSNSGGFYPATTTSGITQAFVGIGAALQKLRIAH